MKLFFAFLLLPLFSLAQDAPKEVHMIDDTLLTKSGYKVYEDMKLKMGTGTLPNGDFKFVRRSATSLFQYSGEDRGTVNSANAFPAQNSGLQFKVVRIDKRGSKKNGYVYYPIVNQGIVRYEVDIENAIANGEIVVPDEYKPKPVNASSVVMVKQEVSIADELAKLKKLFDDGVLTKDEFEAQKKKLLEKSL